MKNIALVSLASEFSKQVSERLADVLHMSYIDYNDYFEYEIMNQGLLLENYGQDLLQKTQARIAKYLCSCDNAIITFSRNIVMGFGDIIKSKCLLIFFQLDENALNKPFEKLLIKEYNKICSELADIVVEVGTKNLQSVEKEVIKKIDKYFK